MRLVLLLTLGGCASPIGEGVLLDTEDPEPRVCTVMPFSGDHAVQFECEADEVCVLHDDANQLPTECVNAGECDEATLDPCSCLQAAGLDPCKSYETCVDDEPGQLICR